jgi:CxxC-x17-CxxC domain-containing protein
MKDFKRGGFGGGNRGGGSFEKRSFGARPSFHEGKAGGARRDDRDDRGPSSRPDMHKAECATCGKVCEVPFKPNGRKPVYCTNCFGGNDRPVREERNDRFEKRESFSKPAFTPQPQADRRIDDVKRQLDDVVARLDTLIKMMEKPAPKKETSVEVVVPKKVAAPKAKVAAPKKVAKKVVAKKKK